MSYRSHEILQGPGYANVRALYKADGYAEEELKRPIIGIANAYNSICPGHIVLRQMAERIREGIQAAGGMPIEFGTIGACDGIAMGHEGMRYILPAREMIANDVEAMVQAHRLDGIVLLGSCDKIIPGMLIGAMRVNLPAIFINGGPSLPGHMADGNPYGGEWIDHSCIQQSEGALQAEKITEKEFKWIEDNAMPTVGSCAMLGTANTMGCRNGLNFTERGFGIRGALGCSDRANTAISKATSADFDFEYIFGKLGVRWFHTGGIYAALSEKSCETVVDAIKIAKKYGTIVSYDLNYRPSMWSAIGGIEKAQEVNKEVAKYVDVMIGNEEDFTACLGFDVDGNDNELKKLNLEGYERMINNVVEKYPNLKMVATTLREVKTATVNDWGAICWAEGRIYNSKRYENLEILDRVGGGDSFASGLIYGMLTTGDPETALELGVAHGALAMTTPGDTSMANRKEVEAVMRGAGARVKR